MLHGRGVGSVGPQPEWLSAVKRAARQPNVFMKVSGRVESAARSAQPMRAPGDPAFYEPWLAADLPP